LGQAIGLVTAPPEDEELDPIVKSGMIKEWVESLTPMTESYCDIVISKVKSWPVKTCDLPSGCMKPAHEMVDLHGCTSVILCIDHRLDLMQAVHDAVMGGGYYCDLCGQAFHVLRHVIDWRPV